MFLLPAAQNEEINVKGKIKLLTGMALVESQDALYG